MLVPNNLLSKAGFIALFMLTMIGTHGQNLVPNPSFETFTMCPLGLSGGPLDCPPWINPTAGTSDYFNACGVGGAGVPGNTFGNQDAHTGVAYGGGYYFTGGTLFDYREYLQVQLTEPLIAGTTYDVSLWYSLADGFGCPMDQLGIYISVDAPSAPGSVQPLDFTPQIQLAGGLITNTTTWLQLSRCYVATGGEQYITIGNFYSDAETDADPACVTGGLSYLYIDDVEVIENGEPPGTIDFDLGDDIEVCDSVILDPGLGSVNYTWEDGSHDPTHVAAFTGTYYLTVTSGCDFGVDSVEVTIIGSAPPVDLGADEVTLCTGDELEIELDSDAGDYTWQDGSTGPDYAITGPGTYSVTLDDGCGETSDDIEVIEANAPAPISLGNDTIICTGEDLLLGLDPDLGDFEWQNGSTSPEFVVTMPGTYSVTVSNMCGSVTDDIEVSYLPDPIVAFDEDVITACPGDVIVFSFDPTLGEYVWQDGTTGPEYEVTDEGIYTVSVINMCASDFAEVFVDYLEEPVLDLGEDLFICPSQLPYIIDLSNVEHVDDYFWHDGSDGAVYEVVQSGTFAVSVSNECFTVSDEIEIVVEDAAPQVNLPEDMTLCPGETLILDVGNILGDYTWQDGSTDPSFEVSESGTYAVTVSNLCGIGMDVLQIAYTDVLPPLDLGADIGLCPGEEVNLQIDLPGISYLWQDGSTGNSFTVDSAGTVILTISNACDETSDTLIATIDGTPPSLDLQDTISLCQGNSVTLDALIGGVSYDWNTGDSSQTLQVSLPGLYVLTVSSTCGTDTDSTVVTDGGDAPTVDLGSDIVLCPGETASIDANTTDDILWHDGTTGNAFVASSAGPVSIQVSNTCGVAYDTVVVSVLNATPSVDLGADTTLCPGEALLLNPGIPNVAYVWNDGSTNNTYTINAPGIVTVEITDACGTSTDALTVHYHPDAPALDLGPDASLCPGESIFLSPGISGVTYVWQDGSTNPGFTATQPGIVHVTLQSTCWEISDTMEIIEDTAGPMVDLGNDTTLCEGGSVLIDAGILGVEYLWQDGSTASSFLASTTQQVILQVNNACGNDSDTIQVTIDGAAPTVSLGLDTTLCEGSSFPLIPAIAGQSILEWQDGSSATTFLVNGPGLYSLQASNNCGAASDTVEVTELFAPEDFTLGSDTVLCPGETVTLVAPNSTDALQWSNGSTGQTFIASSGTIWLRITNTCGSEQDSLSIAINPDVLETDIELLYQICEGETVSIDVSQTFTAQYFWSTGAITPTVDFTTTGAFSVTITSECDAVEEVGEVLVEDCSEHNGDNINDLFTPQTNLPARIGDYQLTIFNRWGDVLFLSKDIAQGWNGTYNNKQLDPGVFVYTIQWRDLDLPNHVDAMRFEHGDMTLVR